MIKEQVSKFLASNIFIAKPTDKVAALDIYKDGAKAGIINTLEDLAKKYGFSESLSSLIRGGAAAASLLPVVKKGSDITVDDVTVLARMSASNPIMSRVGKALPEGWTQTISKHWNDLQEYTATVGNYTSIVKATDFNNFQSVAGLVSRLSGESFNYTFNDADGLSALTSGVIEEASKYNIPKVFDALTENIPDVQTVIRIADQSIPISIINSDYDMLRSINNKLGKGNLKDKHPSILHDFSESFSLKVQEGLQDITVIFNDISTSFTEIDAQWTEYFRIGDEASVDDVSVANASSDSMKEVIGVAALLEDDWDSQKLMTGVVFEKTSVRQEINKSFPRKIMFPYYNSVDEYISA